MKILTLEEHRKRIDNFNGIIENTYPSVFTVKVDDSGVLKNVTCSYSDVLCGDVKIFEK